MKKMGIEALYRKPNTSKRHLDHKTYSYLLQHMEVDRSNQAWAMDITCIPMATGFVYLATVVDWYSRKVLSWRLSNTMDTRFCLEAVDEALTRHGTPEISMPAREAHLPVKPSPTSSRNTISASAWTAKGVGETMSL
jgi:putative transposase